LKSAPLLLGYAGIQVEMLPVGLAPTLCRV
jgi:hypothetical protein